MEPPEPGGPLNRPAAGASVPRRLLAGRPSTRRRPGGPGSLSVRDQARNGLRHPAVFVSSAVTASACSYQPQVCLSGGPMTQILVDGIKNITFHSGVLRVECATVGSDGKPYTLGSLVIPGPVVGQVLQALIKGMQELEKKVREQQQGQQMPAAGERVSACRASSPSALSVTAAESGGTSRALTLPPQMRWPPSSASSCRERSRSRCRVLSWSTRDATRWWRSCRSFPVATHVRLTQHR